MYIFSGFHWVNTYNLPDMSFVKERPYGVASHSLAALPKVTGREGKQWHSPDRTGRFQPGRQKVGGSQKGNKTFQLLAFEVEYWVSAICHISKKRTLSTTILYYIILYYTILKKKNG